MPHPCLLFCPYLPMKDPVVFADWELGPLQSFENRWADPKFKAQATAFLQKFFGTDNKPIDNPALICRAGKPIDGEKPFDEDLRALQLSLVFAFVDRNPRSLPKGSHEGWAMVTADNAELYVWPVDLDRGRITLCAGVLVKVNTFGYKISDPELMLRPPLDLHMPTFVSTPDRLVLTGIYKTILRSLRSPGKCSTADRIRVAVEWFAKAWSNSRTVQWPGRLVYLKTAFEALTGRSSNWKSARRLQKLFKALPHTIKEDSERLVWSPEEKPVHERNWVDKCGRSQTVLITDLEKWFMAFGKARNKIIHEGKLTQFTHASSNPAYNGDFVFTAEFLLRGVIKVKLSKLGYDEAWRSEIYRMDLIDQS